MTPEAIDQAFRSQGVILSEGESERIGAFLEWKEPVLLSGFPLFRWNLEKDPPLFCARIAARREEKAFFYGVMKSPDEEQTSKGLDGLSCRVTPFHGIVGIDPQYVVNEGTPISPQHYRHALGHELVLREHEIDGFSAVHALMQIKSSKGMEIMSLGAWPSLARAFDNFSPRRPVAASILSCLKNDDFLVLSDERKKTMELYVRRSIGAEIYGISHSQEEPWVQNDTLFRDDFDAYFYGKAARLVPPSTLPPNLFRAAEALSERFQSSVHIMEPS